MAAQENTENDRETPPAGAQDPTPAGDRPYVFVMDAARGAMVVFARFASHQRKRLIVAEVLGPYGRNPMLRVQYPLSVSSVAEICRLVTTGQHLADVDTPATGEVGEERA